MNKEKDKQKTFSNIFALTFICLVVIVGVSFLIKEIGVTNKKDDYKNYYKQMTRACYQGANSYKCYKLQFELPIERTQRNRTAIKNQKLSLETLLKHKEKFDYCMVKQLNLSNLSCLNSFVLFKDDIENKELKSDVNQYIEKYPYKTRSIIYNAFPSRY